MKNNIVYPFFTKLFVYSHYRSVSVLHKIVHIQSLPQWLTATSKKRKMKRILYIHFFKKNVCKQSLLKEVRSRKHDFLSSPEKLVNQFKYYLKKPRKISEEQCQKSENKPPS